LKLSATCAASLGSGGLLRSAQVAVPTDRVFWGLDACKKVLACDDVDLVILATPPGFRPLHYRAAIEAGKHVFMEKPRRSDESELVYQLRNWQNFLWLSGGRMVEMHCHGLDAVNWIIDGHPIEVRGSGGRQVMSGPEYGDVCDHQTQECTYASGVKLFSESRHINGCWQAVTEHVHGDQGVVDLSGFSSVIGANRNIRRARGREQANPYHQEHLALLNAIWNGEPYNEGWSSADSTFTAVIGEMAAFSGKVIRWDEAVEKGKPFFPQEELTIESPPPLSPNENGDYEHLVPMPGVYDPFL
jgi:predicted dehydrogenase